jgi:cytochrome c-type biogenesis protein CcmH
MRKRGKPAGWGGHVGARTIAVFVGLVLLTTASPAVAQENDASPGLAAPSQSPEAQTSLADIEDEVMCPICGTSLQLSQSPQAERQRAFIQKLVDEGATKDEVKDALVAEYGPEVLATPETEGFDLAAWLVPVGVILLAAVAIVLGLRRWRRDENRLGKEESAQVDPADRKRLDEDLARYDL